MNEFEQTWNRLGNRGHIIVLGAIVGIVFLILARARSASAAQSTGTGLQYYGSSAGVGTGGYPTVNDGYYAPIGAGGTSTVPSGYPVVVTPPTDTYIPPYTPPAPTVGNSGGSSFDNTIFPIFSTGPYGDSFDASPNSAQAADPTIVPSVQSTYPTPNGGTIPLGLMQPGGPYAAIGYDPSWKGKQGQWVYGSVGQPMWNGEAITQALAPVSTPENPYVPAVQGTYSNAQGTRIQPEQLAPGGAYQSLGSDPLYQGRQGYWYYGAGGSPQWHEGP